MSKIIEKIVEPNKIKVGSTFLLKIKAIRYLTYKEVKDNFTYTTIQNHTYSELKGD
jgi:hypothetical protein